MSLKKSQGYIQVFLDGGLNQQKMGVCNFILFFILSGEYVMLLLVKTTNMKLFLLYTYIYVYIFQSRMRHEYPFG